MSDRKTKVINLFAGPGAGKSTIRAQVFAHMKWQGILVEEAHEFAKDLVWERNLHALSDQIYLFSNQWRRIERLRGQVDYVVTDSPVMLCVTYGYKTSPNAFKELVYLTHLSMPSLNIFLKRTKPYEQTGRAQSEAEAKSLDIEIKHMLEKWSIPYAEVMADKDAHLAIINLLKEG